MSYLAGAAFTRAQSSHEYTGPIILIYPPISVPGYEQTRYGVGPAVGVEAAVTFGRAALTSGVCLQSTTGPRGDGWLIRPNLGMRWRF